MISSILSFVLALTLHAAEPGPAPQAVADAPAAAACEAALFDAAAADLQRLKVTPDIVARARGDEGRFMHALVRVLAALDERLSTRIAQSMIEDPDPLPKVEVLANPFFAQFPEFYRAFAATSLVTLQDQFSDRFDAYELGMLAALIPNSGRIDERTPYPADLKAMELVNLYHQKKNAAELMKSPKYRDAFHQLMAPFASDYTFLMQTVAQAGAGADAIQDRFLPEAVQRSLDRLAQGKVNERDMFVLVGLANNLFGRMSAWGRTHATPRVRMVVHHLGKPQNILYREWSAFIAEGYMTEVLNLSSNVAAMALAFTAIANNDPLPMDGDVLRRHLVSRVEPILKPMLRRLRTAEAPVQTTKPRAAEVKPQIYTPKDLFAPPPERRKPARDRAPAAPAAPAVVEAPAQITTEVDLRAFTSHAKQPRSLDSLSEDTTYEFKYLRDDLSSPLWRVRFGSEVVAWIKDNPAQGKAILTALNLGDYRGQMTGIKPLAGRSRRFDGPIYEVKAYGTFRALLLFHRGAWQVVRISHKDDVHRDLEWVGPLD